MNTPEPSDQELDALAGLAERATQTEWKANEWYGEQNGGWCAVGPHHHGDDDEEGKPARWRRTQ